MRIQFLLCCGEKEQQGDVKHRSLFSASLLLAYKLITQLINYTVPPIRAVREDHFVVTMTSMLLDVKQTHVLILSANRVELETCN